MNMIILSAKAMDCRHGMIATLEQNLEVSKKDPCPVSDSFGIVDDGFHAELGTRELVAITGIIG